MVSCPPLPRRRPSLAARAEQALAGIVLVALYALRWIRHRAQMRADAKNPETAFGSAAAGVGRMLRTMDGSPRECLGGEERASAETGAELSEE